jgi:hypothetical protein
LLEIPNRSKADAKGIDAFKDSSICCSLAAKLIGISTLKASPGAESKLALPKETAFEGKEMPKQIRLIRKIPRNLICGINGPIIF